MRKDIIIVGLIGVGLRAYSQLRIFQAYRVLIELIKQTIFDITAFMSIIFFIIFLMAIIMGLQMTIFDPSDIYKDFGKHYVLFYMFIFGENPYGDLDNMNYSHRWIYFLFSILVNIVAFNLLISILSNTFDNCYSSLDAHHCRTKVQLLHEL